MRRLLLLAAGVAALPLAGPAAAHAQELRVPTETFTLPNGLTVIVHEDHSAPVAAVNVWYHVGSGREVEGRSGFAHLFEHMMFQGSKHVGDDKHFAFIQEAGGTLNGSTNADRTNYFELVPVNYLERVLWLEADRMGFLLDAMTEEKLTNQRDVVKNERRQNYENRPYGMSFIRMGELLYPEDHPYHWPTIGYQEDLTAASMEDVKSFFRTWYAPNNASLVVAGDVRPAEVRRLAEKYFGAIPRGEPIPEPRPRAAPLTADIREILEDRVTLPQVQIAWPAVELWHADEPALNMLANVLGQGKTSRLYERLVYRDQAAQSVSANHSAREIAGAFQVSVMAREGTSLSQMERVVYEEINRLATEGPTEEELVAAKNGAESQFVMSLASTLGKADRLNSYYTFKGKPELFNEDLARFRAVTADDVRRVARTWLVNRPHVVLSTVPAGKRELAAQPAEATP
ncbi:MAG TPA: pitrilysin family protein [Gemmatimonadales bacterium]|nr:pitrilysin family protein [Gemmatimonadales bacterium]